MTDRPAMKNPHADFAAAILNGRMAAPDFMAMADACGMCVAESLRAYNGNLNAAILVVDLYLPGAWWRIQSPWADDDWSAKIYPKGGPGYTGQSSISPARALLMAAVKAKGGEE